MIKCGTHIEEMGDDEKGRYDFMNIINYDILMKHEITNFHKYDVMIL